MFEKIESLLKTFLTVEQIAALKEELFTGISKMNNAVEKNGQMKAKKELVLNLVKKIDFIIENSSRSPLLFKAVYARVKTTLKVMIAAIVDEMSATNPSASNLDTIPENSSGPFVRKNDDLKPKAEPAPEVKTDSDNLKNENKGNYQKDRTDNNHNNSQRNYDRRDNRNQNDRREYNNNQNQNRDYSRNQDNQRKERDNRDNVNNGQRKENPNQRRDGNQRRDSQNYNNQRRDNQDRDFQKKESSWKQSNGDEKREFQKRQNSDDSELIQNQKKMVEKPLNENQEIPNKEPEKKIVPVETEIKVLQSDDLSNHSDVKVATETIKTGSEKKTPAVSEQEVKKVEEVSSKETPANLLSVEVNENSKGRKTKKIAESKTEEKTSKSKKDSKTDSVDKNKEKDKTDSGLKSKSPRTRKKKNDDSDDNNKG